MTYGRRPPLVIWWHMNDQTYLFSMFVYYCIWSQLTSDHHYLSLTRNIYLWNRVTNTITITITITIIISTCDTVSVMTIGFWRTSKAMSLVRALAEYSGWMKILKYLYLLLCFFYIFIIGHNYIKLGHLYPANMLIFSTNSSLRYVSECFIPILKQMKWKIWLQYQRVRHPRGRHYL